MDPKVTDSERIAELEREVAYWREGDGLTKTLNEAHARLREVLGPPQLKSGPFPESAMAYESTVQMAERAVARIAELEAAVLESARHLLGKCDCEEIGACEYLAEQALTSFIEVGPPPWYEFRLRKP
jgi:hypothetical protein